MGPPLAISPSANATSGTRQPGTTIGLRTDQPQVVNPAELDQWDQLVDGHPRCTYFHGAAWARVLQQTYGFKPAYFAAQETSGLPVVLPLMEAASWLKGRRGIALPFADEAGPLYSDRPTMVSLIQAAMEWGRQRGWKSIEFRGGRELFPEAPASLSFYGHTVNLAANDDQQFNRLEASVRRAIRKAEKSGLTITISREPAAMKTFYALQCLTRRKHGLPPQPLAFFQMIQREILTRDQGMIVLAQSGNHPVAASVFFYRGERAIYKYGAADHTLQHLRGANLVMWEAMKWLAHHGCKTLHLGRTSLANDGLRRFKLGWGANEFKMDYLKFDFHRNRWITETDQVTGWHNHLFRALPLGASRLIGSLLYRHMA